MKFYSEISALLLLTTTLIFSGCGPSIHLQAMQGNLAHPNSDVILPPPKPISHSVIPSIKFQYNKMNDLSFSDGTHISYTGCDSIIRTDYRFSHFSNGTKFKGENIYFNVLPPLLSLNLNYFPIDQFFFSSEVCILKIKSSIWSGYNLGFGFNLPIAQAYFLNSISVGVWPREYNAFYHIIDQQGGGWTAPQETPPSISDSIVYQKKMGPNLSYRSTLALPITRISTTPFISMQYSLYHLSSFRFNKNTHKIKLECFSLAAGIQKYQRNNFGYRIGMDYQFFYPSYYYETDYNRIITVNADFMIRLYTSGKKTISETQNNKKMKTGKSLLLSILTGLIMFLSVVGSSL